MNMPKKNETTQRILTLLKLDMLHLYERIKFRKKEYLLALTFKRTREPLKDIFKNRYDTLATQDLLSCEEELIIALDQFYTQVDNLKWYLFHTEELPGAIELKVDKYIKEIETYYDTLCLYLNAKLDTLAEQLETSQHSA